MLNIAYMLWPALELSVDDAFNDKGFYIRVRAKGIDRADVFGLSAWRDYIADRHAGYVLSAVDKPHLPQMPRIHTGRGAICVSWQHN